MKFLNIHILQAFPYSNLNRDDAGSPKSAFYGGVNRARISSQALKRAARIDFEMTQPGERTFRSKLADDCLMSMVDEAIEAAGVSLDDDASKTLKREVDREVRKLTAKESKDDDGKKETLVWLAEAELRSAANKIAETLGAHPVVETASTVSLSIAGFGRMFANAPSVQTEAAVQVAHAITTHEAVTEVDYFTAVDDLRAGTEGDMGAGHLDVAEFTSGVFYRYLNVDREQLAKNWVGIGEPGAANALNAWFSSLLLALPSGKTNVTAPQTLPTLIVVQESTQPVSFAEAFEQPVRGEGGYLAPSLAVFDAYRAAALRVAGNLFGTSARLCLLPNADTDSATLEELVSFCSNWALQGADQ